MFDLVIRGGDLVDGTGGPARRADVAVRGDRIAAIGDLLGANGRVEVDARGMVVAPGFIDVHTHSDAAPFLPNQHLDLRLATIRQGVTTEVCGNCGFSLFPVGSRHPEAVRRWLAALLGDDTPGFEGASEMRNAVEAAGLIGNLGLLVGHGSLRAAVIGFDNRAPTTAEAATWLHPAR